MNTLRRTLLATLLACILSLPAEAQEIIRHFPVPATVSPQLQALIASPAPDHWNFHPRDRKEWKEWTGNFAQQLEKTLPNLCSSLNVSISSERLGGVPVFIIQPKDLPESNRDRILLHFHGGGYVLGQGLSGTQEAILMAGIGKFRIISVDYRMAPDFPYPAAIDDAITVYRELLRTTSPQQIGVFGTSTGGGMTLILPLRAREEGLPLPAALAAGTPWTDLSKTGDSYFTNEGVDSMLVSYDGWLGDAARVYADGHDLKDPMLSPIYGDVKGFPPTLLTSGTRDLFLSNTVRMHLKLREAGVDADLIVFEGLSHAQYHMNPDIPETRFHFLELARFFSTHLKEHQSKAWQK